MVLEVITSVSKEHIAFMLRVKVLLKVGVVRFSEMVTTAYKMNVAELLFVVYFTTPFPWLRLYCFE
jgi:hypothetical protein